MLTILLVKCREVYRKMEEYDRLFTKGRVYKSDIDEPEFNLLKDVIFSKKNIKINKKTGEVSVKLQDGNSMTKSWGEIYRMILCLSNNHVSRLLFTREKYKQHIKNLHNIDVPTKLNNFSKEDELILFNYISCDDYTKKYYEAVRNTSDKYSNVSYEDALEDIYISMMCLDFTCSIYQWMYLRKIFEGTNIPFGNEFFRQSDILIKSTVKDMGEVDYVVDLLPKLIRSLVDVDSVAMKQAREIYSCMDGLNDKEVINFLASVFSPDGIRYFVQNEGTMFLKRKAVLKQLFEKKIITKSEFEDYIDKNEVEEMYRNSKNDALLGYLSKYDLIRLHILGEITRETLVKNVSLRELLTSNFDNNVKIKILTEGVDKRIYTKTETSLIWNLYEEGKFSLKQMKKIDGLRYMHTDTVLRNYQDSLQHKIRAELGEIPLVSEQRLIEFFTPDIVCRELLKENCNVELYMKSLAPVYQKNERDLSEELTKYIKSTYEGEAVEKVVNLYKKGALDVVALKEAGVPEKTVREILSNNYSEELLIELFNNKCISQDTAIDFVGEFFDVKSFDLIRAGMHADIIAGFYSTKDLINMTTGNKPDISVSDLAYLKNDIKTGLEEKKTQGSNLLDMYLNGELSYSQLFDLQQAGVITEKEANDINDKYNLGKGLDALQKIGLKGQSLANVYAAKVNEQREKKVRRQRNANLASSKSKIGVDDGFIIDLYTRLGANDIYSIDADQCPIFDGYMIIPVIDKKIGFLEGGDGRTYILPLKIILEQINNPKGELDIIGNATSRSGFNNEKKYVSSTNHSKNWVRTTIKKALEMSPNIDDKGIKQFLKDNDDLVKASQIAYESKKQKEID